MTGWPAMNKSSSRVVNLAVVREPRKIYSGLLLTEAMLGLRLQISIFPRGTVGVIYFF